MVKQNRFLAHKRTRQNTTYTLSGSWWRQDGNDSAEGHTPNGYDRSLAQKPARRYNNRLHARGWQSNDGTGWKHGKNKPQEATTNFAINITNKACMPPSSFPRKGEQDIRIYLWIYVLTQTFIICADSQKAARWLEADKNWHIAWKKWRNVELILLRNQSWTRSPENNSFRHIRWLELILAWKTHLGTRSLGKMTKLIEFRSVGMPQ